jgi:hypothetical protein
MDHPPTERPDHRAQPEPPRGPGLARRVLTRAVPLWALLAAVVVVAVAFTVVLAVRAASEVRLGPAVGVAQELDVRLLLCNADVDRVSINPRQAELDLEEVLRDEGAKAVTVRLERRDCPEPQP